ncbi:MAG: hypothetical protein AB1458_08865 [Bacteroidota bacterium]
MKGLFYLFLPVVFWGCSGAQSPDTAYRPRAYRDSLDMAERYGPGRPDRYRRDTITDLTDARGKRQGWWIDLSEKHSGFIKEEAFYYENKIDGPYMARYENGITRVEGQYSKGEKAGEWQYYFEDGTKDKYERYENGKLIFSKSSTD